MIPFGYHVVTLLHFNGAVYTRHVLEGCSWHSVNERTLVNGTTIITERTTCRMHPHYVRPTAGDLMILGDLSVSAKNEIELQRLMDDMREKGYRAFRVQAVSDNSHGTPLAHFAVTGA